MVYQLYLNKAIFKKIFGHCRQNVFTQSISIFVIIEYFSPGCDFTLGGGLCVPEISLALALYLFH